MRFKQEELKKVFEGFKGKNILVVGDVMLDSYWWGKVERISPEAPVPIVNINKREFRLGGAANVALNLKKLGAEPIICSAIGNDLDGEIFLKQLQENEIRTDGIMLLADRPTTVKTRVIGNSAQLLRIDSEEDKPISIAATSELLELINSLLPISSLVLFEDYDKGVMTPELIKAVVEVANEKNIPTVVDPKKRNFMFYRNVTLFKPNLRELAEGLKMDLDNKSSIDDIGNAAKELIGNLNIRYALITLSERGVYITDSMHGSLFPAFVRSIYDVSGAGDTVVSVAAMALLAGLPMAGIAQLANLAGGLVCEKAGVVPIDPDELFTEALRELCE